MNAQPILAAAAALDVAAALLHLACIAGGADWYRFMGACEPMARAVARGAAWPAAVTVVIAAVLAGWSAAALSGAGLLPRSPLTVPALFAIAALCLVRGGAVLAFPGLLPGRSRGFLRWSSLVVLALGALHLAGAVLIVRRG